MKIVLDVEENKKINKNDIIVFDDKKNRWIITNKIVYLNDVYTQLNYIFKLFDEKQKAIDTFKEEVNKQLEKQYKVLQILTKEN